MEALLQNRENEVDITKGVLLTALRNRYAREILEVKLSEAGNTILITEELIRSAQEQDSDQYRLFLETLSDTRCGCITPKLLTQLAARSCYDMLLLLLEMRGEEAKINEDILVAVVRNEDCGDELLDLFLDLAGDRKEIQVTKDLLLAATCNATCADELMTLLLDLEGSEEFQITTDLLMAASCNRLCGERLLRLFLNRRGREFLDRKGVEIKVIIAAVLVQGEADIAERVTAKIIDHDDLFRMVRCMMDEQEGNEWRDILSIILETEPDAVFYDVYIRLRQFLLQNWDNDFPCRYIYFPHV
ncbi:hypothetical protein QBC35DRAFT_40072 [Podospora australis]|uniref:Uncharacterized protein n=1 Tax=Podospora australis TaxID=1536484 RepID=A0AAN7AFK8_9PEZI|nr:hypothetical protein QBC35DRAFT_40072 [Podospora australis]